MQIEFVNHASVLIEHEGTSVLCDPWLWGDAFMHGWDLLCPTEWDAKRLEQVDYIWLSHEHPDHFSPRVLKSIDPAKRAGITILYQKTQDKRVVKFCEAQGFRVQELGHLEKVSLGKDFQVQCGHVLFFDSWLCIYAGGRKILNVNDCCVDAEVAAAKIKRYTGQVDVLLTQFSYAAWKGGPSDQAMRRASAQQKLRIVRDQISAFAPRFTLPFASYIYFSHEENRYLNDSVNTAQDAHDAIVEGGSKPIVMHPGQRWTIGEAFDNAPALAHYQEAYANLPQRDYHAAGPSVGGDELMGAAQRYIQRLSQRNSFTMIALVQRSGLMGFFQPFRIRLDDLDQIYEFNIRRGLYPVRGEAFDVQMHSESLKFVFDHDFGYDTLSVNGRFQCSLEAFSKMSKTFAIGPLNSTGRYVDQRFFMDYRMLEKFVRSLRGFVVRMRQVSAQSSAEAVSSPPN